MRGRRHSAWGCMFHRQCFQINLTEKCWTLFLCFWEVDFFCLIDCFPHWELESQVKIAGRPVGRNWWFVCVTWQSLMQAGVFLHVLFYLLSICAWISLLFFAVEILPMFVGIQGFMGNLSWPVPEKKFRNALVFLVLQEFLYTWEQYFGNPGGCLPVSGCRSRFYVFLSQS